MFTAASLLTFFLFVISTVDARSPTVTLPLAKRILDISGGAINLVQKDQARVIALKQRGAAVHFKRQAVASATNVTNQVVSYIASMGVGSPPTTYNLIIDTGTSNTWIGADRPYVQTHTSHRTNDTVSVSYGTYSFFGEEWLDEVSFNHNLYAAMASIGVANHTTGFHPGVDGVLGLGPIGLTIGTLTKKPNATIPTITDCFYDAEIGNPYAIIGISFAPSTSDNGTHGELTFGGTDHSKYIGEIIYAPITSTKPASNFWGIDQSIRYGKKTILSQTAGIVDTGTTLVLIASDAYDAYKLATGGTEDEGTGLLKLTPSQYDDLDDLNFVVYSQTYVLTPNGQIWPRTLNSYIGGSKGAIYSIVNSIGTPSGQGFDFVNGQAFVERFYSVFDTVNWQVGFAATSYTNATTN